MPFPIMPMGPTIRPTRSNFQAQQYGWSMQGVGPIGGQGLVGIPQQPVRWPMAPLPLASTKKVDG